MKRSREPEELDSEASANDLNSPDSRASDALPTAKITGLDPVEAKSNQTVTMKCVLPPHRDAISFNTYDEYDTHYLKAHTNRCLECRKNFPSEHLLSVHIEECHDSFVAVKRERGEHTYTCFVEGCERKCLTPPKRRLHLIDKHMYPKNFFFAVTKEGIDGRRSLLIEDGHRRRRSSNNFSTTKESRRRSSLLEKSSSKKDELSEAKEDKPQPSKQSLPNQSKSQDTPDTDMEDLAGAMSALQFIPPSVRFGRGGGRAGFSKR